MKRNAEWYNNQKDKILKMYYYGMRVEDIAIQMECSRYSIYQKFNEWNIVRRNRIKVPLRSNALYEVDYNYFKIIDTEHKAYWYGFLLADGHVNDKEINLCVQKKDINILEKFKRDLATNYLIKYDQHNNPFLTITCKELSKSLLDKGFNHRKSWYLDFDKILSYVPNELVRHFIRGMFDGDGSLKYYTYKYLQKPQYHLGYTGLKNVCNFLKEFFKIDRKLVHESSQTYTLITRNSEKILEICNYLYNDSTIYLKRKYDTFNQIKMMTFNDYNKAISSEIKV